MKMKKNVGNVADTSDDGDDSSTSEIVEAPVTSTAAPKAKRQKTGSLSTVVVPAPLEIVSGGTTVNAIKNPRKIIVLLDQASLETVKSKKGDFELLNCDDHRGKCVGRGGGGGLYDGLFLIFPIDFFF
jgi:hypothetical protein